MLRMPLVVVGANGSDASASAVVGAIGQARMQQAQLVVVAAWQYKADYFSYGRSTTPQGQQRRDEAARWLDDACDLATRLAPELTVERVLRRGHSGRVLVECSQHASLLVVGYRRHDFWSRVRRGSTSRYCARNAPCSVLLVHADDHQPGRAARLG